MHTLQSGNGEEPVAARQMRRTLASGAAAYLTKPLDLHNALTVIDSLRVESRENPATEVSPS